MHASPRLSIVVPVLDEAAAIGPCLAALATLRTAGHEVIVVDGGSADGTPALCAGHADRVLASARGRARQMNAGAAVAQGDVLLFLHADTLLPADAAAALAAALGNRAGAPQWGRFDVTIDGRSPMFAVIAALMNLRSRCTGIATGDQAMFVRREAFARVGGFADQPLMEDIELSRRLLRRCGRPACLRCRVVTSARRWQRHGVCRTVALMWLLRLRYWLGTPAAVLARAYR